MRTAEEYIKERYPFYDENISQKDVELNGEQVTELINKARKEAIEECAEIVDNAYRSDFKINKPTILSLIDELK